MRAEHEEAANACSEAGCDRVAVSKGLCRKHYSAAHYQANKEKRREQQRAWEAANPDARREIERRYVDRHPSSRAASHQRWRERNPEAASASDLRERRRRVDVGYSAAYRQRNAERVRAKAREYQQKNLDSYAAVAARRRAKKRSAPGSHSKAEWLALLAFFHGGCAYCASTATTRDHVVPLARGGADSIENILPACKPCNSSKGDRLLAEWTV
jgi:5-methylcytosine-specific restriction endonuclease McrA